jgi:hypothetical protein
MQFLLNLLRIKGLYMFRALLAHPQEALHKQHLVYTNIGTSKENYTKLMQQYGLTRRANTNSSPLTTLPSR